MKPMIEYLVKELVDEPEHVSVTEVPGDESTTYEVHVAPGDLIIGDDDGRKPRPMLCNPMPTTGGKLTRDRIPSVIASSP